MSILHKIQPGLRGKLSLFMGVMLFALIGIVLAIVLRLQRETLASVAEQEVSRFLRPVETLSLDVDTVVENLIRLETLRLRIEQHERDFKNEQPDYYQRYFTENHINQAEREFRRQIKAGYRDEELSEDRWEVYRSLARWFAYNPRHTPGAQDTYEIRRHALEWKIREEFDYKNRIAIAFQPLDLARYRSESITLGRMIRFDTRDAAPPEKRRSAINSFVWGQVPEFHGAMDDIHEPFQAGEPMIEPLRLQYETEQANYFLVFRTLYRNPPVSERARIVKEVLNADAPSIWKQYAIQEGEIISRLRGLAEAIRARQEKLRAEDPPTPIPWDAEILKLYAEYATEIQNRRQLVDEFRIQVFEKKDPVFAGKLEDLNALRDELQQLPDDATEEQKSQILERIGELKKVIDERSVSFTREDAVADAFEHMRDAALYYDVKIPYRPDQNLYQKYGNDPGLRRDLTYYRQNLREWILKPYNELYANEYRVGWGLLAMTRSEAEERMFELDTTPLRELYDQLLFENAAGFTRILMDETESRDRLIANRDRLLDTALSIGLRIIFLSFLLSGVLVAVIQRIIAGARRVGQGDLKVRFDYSGRDELGTLTESLNSMVHGLREREELRGELSAAEEIQKRLIPQGIPKSFEEYVSYGMFYKAMHGVGGDYFDFIPISRDEMAICVADVSNHGVGPALVMTLMRSHLHTILKRGEKDPYRIALELNERTYAETPENIFITLFLGIYNRKSGEMIYVSAGHNPPYVYRYKTESLETVPAGGMPIGAVDNELFSSIIKNQKAGLAAGDLFFQYTDGVNEAMNALDHLYGNERLEKILLAMGRKKPEAIIQTIASDVERFTGKVLLIDGPSELNDDIAMLAFRRLK